ncbi:glycoside hydrolase family 3 C-terminal domain-containing protein [Sphingomonas hengshuiensis]|uniref:glycoside hydrolase family 3 C-terminal domain-containing protein n=1 Tax=Sphingomonas hengshuiensis TaxID=1609977 RepID=UPI0009814974|nr:glycoside hydrolase family 3 C-terminal domain-containing protein [Sphingomonas hengshuiensis]
MPLNPRSAILRRRRRRGPGVRAVEVAASIAFAIAAPAAGQERDHPWADPTRPAEERARLVVAAMTPDEKLALLQGDTVLDENGTGVNPCVGHISAIPRLGLPALCMGDGPAGVGNGLDKVTQFPAPIMGAASWNVELMARYGAALGAEHAAKGRNVVLAPTINIIRTPKWGRTAESLSEDPYLTAVLGSAITRGIQSNGVIATPKHFAANNQEWLRLGDAPDYAAIDAHVSPRALHEIYFPAFESVVKTAGAGSIMCAYNRVNGRYACENPELLGTLRGWGFDGFVVADWYFAHRSTVASVKAGLDISMPGGPSPFGFAEFYGPPLKQALARGDVAPADIDAMVTRIVTPMFRLGLVDRPVRGSSDADARSPEHLALSEAITEQGTVLLRNENAVLPLAPSLRSIAVIGDDAGANVQTTERYGGFVKNDVVRPGAPLDAIRAALPATTQIRYARGTLGIGALPAVPAAAFRDLKATYYATPDLSGAPVATRAEAMIDAAEAGIPGLPKIWSARWEGTIVPPRAGRYRFSLTGGGEIRLVVDGRPVAVMPKHSFRLVSHGIVDLAAGKPVTVRVDYSNAATISPPELRLGWEVPDTRLIDEAVAAARASDVAVVFVSDHVSEGADRTDLRLPGDQDALIEAVAAANPRTVVVLHTVGPVLMPWRDKVSGILAAWYPGEQAAESIAALLVGRANPSGKLPVTFPADEENGPTDAVERYPGIGTDVRYDEDIFVGYRWYDSKRVKPLYPFGFGLSYTRFGYEGLTVSARPEGGWAVRATVRNTGARDGAEVAQLYIGMPKGSGAPPRQLKGFARVALKAGEAQSVEFTLTDRDLSFWDTASNGWKRPAGRFSIAVGPSSRDLPLKASLDVPAR